jgi:hypothetical protein
MTVGLISHDVTTLEEQRAAGDRLWLEWNTKGVAKRVSPRAYDALRRLRSRV